MKTTTTCNPNLLTTWSAIRRILRAVRLLRKGEFQAALALIAEALDLLGVCADVKLKVDVLGRE